MGATFIGTPSTEEEVMVMGAPDQENVRTIRTKDSSVITFPQGYECLEFS